MGKCSFYGDACSFVGRATIANKSVLTRMSEQGEYNRCSHNFVDIVNGHDWADWPLRDAFGGGGFHISTIDRNKQSRKHSRQRAQCKYLICL